MDTLVVHSHPSSESYSRRLCDAAVRGATAAGGDVEVLHLSDLGVRAAMTCEERLGYNEGRGILDPELRRHADLLARAEQLVLVYPTWWSGMPAQLKGWIDRVFVEGVAFELRDDRVHGKLSNLRRLVGVTTYGSRRRDIRLLGDNGRRLVNRNIRILCGPRTRVSWFGLYDLDRASSAERTGFLDVVERGLARR